MFGLSRRVTLILVALLFVVGALIAASWAAEYLWFNALGLESVFLTIRAIRVFLFAACFLVVFGFFWVNFRIYTSIVDMDAVLAALTTQVSAAAAQQSTVPVGLGAIAGSKAKAKGTLTALAALIALLFAFNLYGHWDTVLRYWWSQPVKDIDPIFGRDIGFYLFELTFIELLQNTLTTISFIAFSMLMVGYRYAGRLPADWRQLLDAPTNVLKHLGVVLLLFLVAFAWGFYLDRFELLQSTRGIVQGAGYTDIHVLIPAFWIMIVLTLAIVPILLIARLRRMRNVIVPLAGTYVVSYLIFLVVGPVVVQSVIVEPNELEREAPFLRHNIEFTRKAYNLDQVDIRTYGVEGQLNEAVLSENQQTVDNIRVWDWRPLSETFRQLQQIRTYYSFGDVDVDRYTFANANRQVMLAARELSNRLPDKADTWVNRRLQYTHGYGLVMSLAAEKLAEGDPVLAIKDLPPQGALGTAVERPAIYYGEKVPGYALVATAVPEFDYPKGDQNVYTHYSGHGGVRIDTIWKKLLFAWHRMDANIAITSYTTEESRIQVWRDIKTRMEKVAPFLRLDADPYLVVSAGKLVWIQDAYTVSDLFPYSEGYGPEFNYIRNSVKAVIDAYNGDVTLYVMDTQDPVLAVYRKALPKLFSRFEDLPDDLRQHLRYPQDLFQAQVTVYSRYHMTVPQVFYNSEDLWAAPREKYGGEIINLKPYYVLVRLPGEEALQFLLMTPMTPANRPNMIAWIAARSDYPGYGELLVYKLPKDRLIRGPIQVEATIDQDTLVSQQLSLWDQRGSRVLRGNLLIIPIDQSFIYVEPVYLIAEDSGIPQLKRVIVSDGERLAMEPTLRESLQVVYGGQSGSRLLDPNTAQTDELSEARKALAAAEEALSNSDWDLFGQSMQKLKQLLGN